MPIFNAERSEITRAYHSPKGMIGTVDKKDLLPQELTLQGREFVGNNTLVRATRIEIRGGSWFFHSRPIFDGSSLEGAYVLASIDEQRQGLGDWYDVYADGRVVLYKAIVPRREVVVEKSDPMLQPKGRERFFIYRLINNWGYEEKTNNYIAQFLNNAPRRKRRLYQVDTKVEIEVVDEEGSTGPVLRYTELIVEYPTPFDIISVKFPKKNLTQ